MTLPCMWRQLTGHRAAYEFCIQAHECYGIRRRETAGNESLAATDAELSTATSDASRTSAEAGNAPSSPSKNEQ